MAQKCLQILIQNSLEDYNLFIEQGEYLTSIHKYESAIDSFNSASDLIFEKENPDENELKRINSLIKEAKEGKPIDHLIENPLAEMVQEDQF